MGQYDHPDRLKAEVYRAQAVEALDHAAHMKDELTRKSWEAIGSSYNDMAERLERKLRGPFPK